MLVVTRLLLCVSVCECVCVCAQKQSVRHFHVYHAYSLKLPPLGIPTPTIRAQPFAHVGLARSSTAARRVRAAAAVATATTARCAGSFSGYAGSFSGSCTTRSATTLHERVNASTAAVKAMGAGYSQIMDSARSPLPTEE